MLTYPSKRRKVTLNTLSKTNKKSFLILFTSFFFINTICGPGDHKLTSKELFGISVLAILFPSNFINSYEPNGVKESAFCIDVPNKNITNGNNLESIINPKEDIDYYKIIFKNQRISLSHFTRHSEFFHILLESDSGTLYDSRNPEAANVFIESNQLVQIPIQGETYEARTIITKDLNFVYLKLLHNERYSYPIGGNPYSILLKNGAPSITDTSSDGFFRLTGEFEPCPR